MFLIISYLFFIFIVVIAYHILFCLCLYLYFCFYFYLKFYFNLLFSIGLKAHLILNPIQGPKAVRPSPTAGHGVRPKQATKLSPIASPIAASRKVRHQLPTHFVRKPTSSHLACSQPNQLFHQPSSLAWLPCTLTYRTSTSPLLPQLPNSLLPVRPGHSPTRPPRTTSAPPADQLCMPVNFKAI